MTTSLKIFSGMLSSSLVSRFPPICFDVSRSGKMKESLAGAARFSEKSVLKSNSESRRMKGTRGKESLKVDESLEMKDLTRGLPTNVEEKLYCSS